MANSLDQNITSPSLHFSHHLDKKNISDVKDFLKAHGDDKDHDDNKDNNDNKDIIKITRTFAAAFSDVLDTKILCTVEDFLNKHDIPLLPLSFTREQSQELDKILREEHSYPFGVTEYEFLKQQYKEECTNKLYQHLKNMKIYSINYLLAFIKDPTIKQQIQNRLQAYQSSDDHMFALDECIDNYKFTVNTPYFIHEIIDLINTTMNTVENFRAYGSATASLEIQINNMISQMRGVLVLAKASTKNIEKANMINRMKTAISDAYYIKPYIVAIKNNLHAIETFTNTPALETPKKDNPTKLENPTQIKGTLFNSGSSPPGTALPITLVQNRYTRVTSKC